ncbi:secretin N-terminal domain-containing protein [Uliginosibacterium sediminicola]|uniref:Secretin N-terminal domain-containing protein n=1 Tax=Uliginosibacterium sediminicola TaxID=2024550 RepID=A0ABU9Z0H2_9RHOO
MTTTIQSIRQRTALLLLGSAMLGVLAACASSSTQELEYSRALIAAGRAREALPVLQKAHAARPGDAAISAALESVQAQLADPAAPAPPLAESAASSSAMAASSSVAAASSASAQSSSAAPMLPTFTRFEASSVGRQNGQAGAAPLVAAQTVVLPLPQHSSSARKASSSSSEAAAASSASAASRVSSSARAQAASAASELDALNKKVTLQFRDAPVRSLFDAIGKSTGLNIVIDKDVPPDLRTSIYLKDTTVRAALEKIVLTTRLGWSMMDQGTLLIYPDEPAKQSDYQTLVVRGFHLANADVKLVANSLKTVLKFKDVVVDEKLNMIVVRDTPQALALAQQLIALHDVPEPEVMLEVAILEVSKGKLENLGIAWPGSLSLSPIARTVAGTSTTTVTTTSTTTSDSSNILTLRDLFNLTPASLGLTIGSTSLNANQTDSAVNVLANPRIRAKNREKAKILIGERVPNISSTATSNGVTSQNITYVDVGLKLDVEPQIFPGNEIGLKIALEVSSINSTVENKTSGTVAYRIGTRTTSTVLRLKDGENQVLAGLIQDSDRKSASKVPLLGEIPILGQLFRSDSVDKGKTEILLSITPRLIRGISKPGVNEESFEAGTVTSVRGRRAEGADAVVNTDAAPVAQPQSIVVNVPADNAPKRSRED